MQQSDGRWDHRLNAPGTTRVETTSAQIGLHGAMSAAMAVLLPSAAGNVFDAIVASRAVAAGCAAEQMAQIHLGWIQGFQRYCISAVERQNAESDYLMPCCGHTRTSD